MADRTLQILPGGQGSAPFTYTIPASTAFTLQAVRATFDGSAAAGAFLPCVQLISDAGQLMAQTVGSSVAAGGSADASFFPLRRAAGGVSPTPGIGSYPQLVAAVGNLVGYWRMGAASGDEPDTSGFPPTKDQVFISGTIHGTYQVAGAAVLVAAGQDDGAFRFNFNQSTDNAPSPTAGDTFSADDGKFNFAGNPPYSVACFARPTSGWAMPAGKEAPIVSQRSTANFRGFTLEQNPAGDLFCRRGSTTAWDTVTVLGVMIPNTWTHVCMTYDGTTIRVYIDGVLANSAASALSQGAQGAVHLGTSRFQDQPGSPDRFWYGTLDEVSVWNTALSAAAVAALAQG